MFRRKSSKKKSETAGSSSRASSSEDFVEDGENSDDKPQLNSPQQRKGSEAASFIPSEIIRELFTVPLEPEVELKSEVLSSPGTLLQEYHTSLAKLLEWSLAFSAGWCGLSYAWLLCAVLCYHALTISRGQSKCKTAVAAGGHTAHEKVAVQAGGMDLSQLPSWVAFPDFDRAEWINVIMKKVWPKIGNVANLVTKRLIEPKINEILNRLFPNLDTISQFRIKELVLGSVPARVGGIKVHDRNTTRNEIVMDIEVIYAGDARVRFSLQGLDCELNQIQFRCTARLVLAPLLEALPVVGGLQLYFVQHPTLDYSLGGLASAAELPGISNIVRSLLDSVIRRGFLWPNRFSLFLPVGPGMGLTEPGGVVRAQVLQGRHLVSKDLAGKSDPYVVLSVGQSRHSFAEQYVACDVNPVWNYSASFPVEEPAGLSLQLEVYDYDRGDADDFMGRCSLELGTVAGEGRVEQWLPLQDTKKGEVEVVVEWLPVLPGPVTSASTRCILSLFIDSCRNLSTGRGSPPFARVEARLGSEQNKAGFCSKPRGPTDQPVYQEQQYFLSSRPTTDFLLVSVVDQKSAAVLGRVTVQLAFLLRQPNNRFCDMEWRLEGGAGQSESFVTLSAQLWQY